MALFYECMLQCARKLLDTADIVREAMLRQPRRLHGGPEYNPLDVQTWQSRLGQAGQTRPGHAFRVRAGGEAIAAKAGDLRRIGSIAGLVST
jgi:hypothetical protein